MAPLDVDRYWGADVIIVGAGASGLLAATKLIAAGQSVLIVERSAIGAAQSNHSHGYMHRGHIYLKPSAALVDDLGRGADAWQALMSEAGIRPVTTHSRLAFVNSYEAEVAAHAWMTSGLVFEETTAPHSILASSFKRMFETREQTYDFTPWLRSARQMLEEKGVRFVHAEALGLERDGQNVSGVVIRDVDRTLTLSSSYVVLCAGIGNLELASSVTRFRGHGMNRTSMMMVLESPDLDEISLVAHGHPARGLFIVSRPSESGTTWLISNYLSYATETVTETAARLWARDIRRTLEQYTEALSNRSSRWGYYIAPKGELRNLRHTMQSHSVQRYGLDNLCVASPTKLTLAPLLADLITESVSTELHAASRPAQLQDYAAPASDIPIAAEMWRSAAMSPIESLMAL